ncbi:MAG: hypothetical protein RL094_355 [Candidatus Parcubacteria bacterium]|jgi:SET domain-containing protein
MKTWVSEKVQKALHSKISGLGLFTIQDIKKDEVIAVKNGYIMNREQLKMLNITGQPELPLADDLFISPKTEEEKIESMLYINHSCTPNTGMRGDVCVVVMRDVEAGEELTIDYGSVYNGEYEMACLCKSPNCRKVITGNDYLLPEVKKIGKYASAYIQTKF